MTDPYEKTIPHTTILIPAPNGSAAAVDDGADRQEKNLLKRYT